MDAEVDATLLRESRPEAARAELLRAAASYGRAAELDRTSVAVEERVLVMAAAAMERGEESAVLPALEAISETRPRSWRGHYVLGQVRRSAGDASGAVVALEHADALRPLGDADVLALAGLYVATGAPKVAASRLRRVVARSADPAAVATARRLLLGIAHPEAETDLEEAGRIAVSGRRGEFDGARERIARVLALEPDLWEAHFAAGLIARRAGDRAAAEAAFRRVLAIHPTQPETLEQLSQLKSKKS